jgi:hypothetical protein
MRIANGLLDHTARNHEPRCSDRLRGLRWAERVMGSWRVISTKERSCGHVGRPQKQNSNGFVLWASSIDVTGMGRSNSRVDGRRQRGSSGCAPATVLLRPHPPTPPGVLSPCGLTIPAHRHGGNSHSFSSVYVSSCLLITSRALYALLDWTLPPALLSRVHSPAHRRLSLVHWTCTLAQMVVSCLAGRMPLRT